MSPSLHLKVITPTSMLLDVPEAAWVQVRLADGGGIGIWPLHSPLLAESVACNLVYADETGEHRQPVGAGILSVRGDMVTLLTLGAASTVSATRMPEWSGTARFQRLKSMLPNMTEGFPE